jgi:hypothetical protein
VQQCCSSRRSTAGPGQRRRCALGPGSLWLCASSMAGCAAVQLCRRSALLPPLLSSPEGRQVGIGDALQQLVDVVTVLVVQAWGVGRGRGEAEGSTHVSGARGQGVCLCCSRIRGEHARRSTQVAVQRPLRERLHIGLVQPCPAAPPPLRHMCCLVGWLLLRVPCHGRAPSNVQPCPTCPSQVLQGYTSMHAAPHSSSDQARKSGDRRTSAQECSCSSSPGCPPEPGLSQLLYWPRSRPAGALPAA